MKLCGTLDPLPYVYRSDGPEIQVNFVSDSSNSGRGFDATYEIVANEGPYYVTGEFGEVRFLQHIYYGVGAQFSIPKVHTSVLFSFQILFQGLYSENFYSRWSLFRISE